MPSTIITIKNNKANTANTGAMANRIKNINICNIHKQ